MHKHKENEEVYIVLAGETVPVREGSCLRITPETGRAIRAAKDSPITYACIQAASGSLRQYTRTDGVIMEEKTGW